MKKIIFPIIIVAINLAVSDQQSGQAIDRHQLYLKFVETVRMLYDKNYNVEEKHLKFAEPHRNYLLGIHEISVYHLAGKEYTVHFDASTGKVTGTMAFGILTEETCVSKEKLSDEELIKLSYKYMKLLDIETENIKFAYMGGIYGCRSLMFGRLYKNYAFRNDWLKVSFTQDGKFEGIRINMPSPNPSEVDVVITKEAAFALSEKYFNEIKKKYKILSDVEVEKVKEPRLFIVNPNFINKTDKYPSTPNLSLSRLAWVTFFEGKKIQNMPTGAVEVWVDAKTGECLGGEILH